MNDLVPRSVAEKMAAWRTAAKPWPPHSYQERGLKFMLEDAQCGLFLDPGLGKTSITLAAFTILLKKKLMRRALVVAPLRAVYDVWPAEISDWKDFNYLGIAILHGDQKTRERVLRQLEPRHQVVLINFEGLPWLMRDRKRMAALGADVLVIDESSKMKSGVTQRFRALRPHLGEFKRRYILTGSPRPRNYEDLWGQIYILDRGAALGAWVTHYRNTYFYPTGYQMREWALLPGADKQINAAVAPMILRLDAKDYLKLPKELERRHLVSLPEKVQAEYDRLEETMMSTLFDQPMVTSAAARSKCCQIANGAVYLDAGTQDDRWPSRERPVKVMHTAKVEAVVDLYEELQGEPLLLAIGYHHDVAAIRRALGAGIPCINGQTTRTQASDFIDHWNRGLLPMLMVHPASAGHALNLQKFNARHVGFFYIPDDFDHFDQCFRRVWRQGNKADFVMRHLFIAESTVDVPKMRNLERKGNGQRDFLDAMRAYSDKKYGKAQR
jgi:hypothetical protein